MSDSHLPLPQTLGRIKTLCSRAGKPLDDVLDVRNLALATGLAEADVELLLAGEAPAPADSNEMVRQRVRFLYEMHADDNGDRYRISDIAAAIEQTPTWTKRLVEGDAKPNLVVGHALCRYYNVATSFLTDPPAEALNRELQPILLDLEIEVDPEEALKLLNVRNIAGRSPAPEKANMRQLARMVADIAADLAEVKRNLPTAEGNR